MMAYYNINRHKTCLKEYNCKKCTERASKTGEVLDALFLCLFIAVILMFVYKLTYVISNYARYDRSNERI